jgi:prepilin-type N-terminal cleavage/methylation domain-containing protein
MRTKTFSGFTLVELMIVVAVIGTLMSIAIPIYANYVARSKVAEAAMLLSGIRNEITEHYNTNNKWASPKSLGAKVSGTYTHNLITGGEHPTYYIEISMRGEIGLTAISGKNLRMIYTATDDSWQCTTDGTANPIPPTFVPSSCKE